MILDVRDLSMSFGAVHALRGVSFQVQAGSATALIGPNGSGKSTCFQCLGGQLVPRAGQVWFDGAEVSGLGVAARTRRGMGRTFQLSQVASSLTVRQHVALSMAARAGRPWASPLRARLPVSGEAVEQHLQRFTLLEQAERVCGTLPYPELKRVELASVLAQRPKLLLMDEPTAGMTREDRHDLMAVVMAEVRGGLSVLFTEHSMDVVFGYAERIVVLVRGAIIAEGSPDSVRDDPAVAEAYLGSRAGRLAGGAA